jgi:hypothetical protein
MCSVTSTVRVSKLLRTSHCSSNAYQHATLQADHPRASAALGHAAHVEPSYTQGAALHHHLSILRALRNNRDRSDAAAPPRCRGQ